MPDEPIDRRTFLIAAAGCACAACPLAAAVGKPDAKKSTEPVEAGNLKDYAKDGAYDKFAEEHGFFVIRSKGHLFAASSTCTHKRGPLKLKGDAIACPKHGARFDLQGVVTKAPAKEPLPRYAISADEAGKITVDPSKTFDKKHWDDKASFIAMK